MIHDRGQIKKCYAACVDQHNKAMVTYSGFPNLETYPFRVEFCLVMRKVAKTCRTTKNIYLKMYFPFLCDYIDDLQDVS